MIPDGKADLHKEGKGTGNSKYLSKCKMLIFFCFGLCLKQK